MSRRGATMTLRRHVIRGVSLKNTLLAFSAMDRVTHAALRGQPRNVGAKRSRLWHEDQPGNTTSGEKHGNRRSRRFRYVHGRVKRRNPGQPEFVQAVQEVSQDVFDFIRDKETISRISDSAAHRRTGPRHQLPGLLGRRQGQHPRTTRLARAEQ